MASAKFPTDPNTMMATSTGSTEFEHGGTSDKLNWDVRVVIWVHDSTEPIIPIPCDMTLSTVSRPFG